MRGHVAVPNERISKHAARLAQAPHVERAELALAFDRSSASSVELHVEGRNFYPPMLADIEAATSSVHINQFGFRPGQVGDRFAEVLVAKAGEGVPVRLVVDRQGTDPERRSRELYERLVAAGIVVCVNRATQPRAPRGPLGRGGATHWNLRGLGHIDHRKAVVVDGRVGWVGGAGIEDHFENGAFHDLFVRVEGPVVAQLQLVFVASVRWLGCEIPVSEIPELFPPLDEGANAAPAIVLHNAPGRYRPITDAIAALLDGAQSTLDVVNPYVTDRRMIGRIVNAARRGARVRLFVPAKPNNWACGAAEEFHHRRLLEAGVQIHGYPKMLHAKAFIADGEHVLAGTCNLEAWSLKRFFEIDIGFQSTDLAAQFEDRFLAPAENISSDMQPPSGLKNRARAAAFAAISPLL
jgi:cardiolipin synthase